MEALPKPLGSSKVSISAISRGETCAGGQSLKQEKGMTCSACNLPKYIATCPRSGDKDRGKHRG